MCVYSYSEYEINNIYKTMALQEELEIQGNWLFRYRGLLPLIILFLGVSVYVHTELYPESFILEETVYEPYYEFACLLISLLGLLVRALAVGCSASNTSGRNAGSGQIADTINKTGIYSVLRHPLYLGNFLMWLGIALLTGNVWFVLFFCFLYWVYYERIMFAEEQFLRRKFGEFYTSWADKTPAFIPNLKLYVKPALPFSFKKVLRQEKNGLLALFLIFFCLDTLGEVLEKQTDYNYYIFGAFLFSLVAYCVLRYMKKRTKLLDLEYR